MTHRHSWRVRFIAASGQRTMIRRLFFTGWFIAAYGQCMDKWTESQRTAAQQVDRGRCSQVVSTFASGLEAVRVLDGKDTGSLLSNFERGRAIRVTTVGSAVRVAEPQVSSKGNRKN